MFIAHTGYLELFDLVVKHILPGMGLFFYFVLHFNCKFAAKINPQLRKNSLTGDFDFYYTDNVFPTTGLVPKYGRRTVRAALTPALA